MRRHFLRLLLGGHLAHALECDECFDRMIAEFIESLS